MRQRIYWNNGWRFSPDFSDEMLRSDYDTGNLEEVRLPHSVAETPFHYFDESSYQVTSCYRREFVPEDDWQGKTAIVSFEGAAHKAGIYLNGEMIADHENGYTAFSVDISPYIEFGRRNILAVRLESSEELNQPPFGHVIDYMTYGGLYREVYIEVLTPVNIADVFVTTADNDRVEKKLRAEISLRLSGKDSSLEGYTIVQRLENTIDGSILTEYPPAPAAEFIKKENTAGYAADPGDITLITEHRVRDVSLWEPQAPALYRLETELHFDGCPVDGLSTRFGFRSVEFRADGFFLNGQKLKLRGLNRHQSYPYVGYAMPRSLQEEDAEILRRNLGLNAVRTSHYPQSRHFLNRCDELGLLVFTEIPGWQHIGDDAWKDIACRNTAEMVLQYRNHPSIILWGVRINESLDDDVLYGKTNDIAHALDGSRPTSGVRYLEKSSLLEDVYAYNDFSHTGGNAGVRPNNKVTPDCSKAYLVSEYNGHMFPTKSFDAERLRTEHALRHANVVAGIYRHDEIAGGFGWCMADYNTHRDFGSGDRVCYHGVLDMFRNPKPAAALYASQADADDEADDVRGDSIIGEISSSLEIGEHPAGYIGPVYAFTNADSVKVYKNGSFIREFFPDSNQYASMPHPPVIIDDFIGELLERNEGYGHRKAESFKNVMRAVQHYGQDALPLKYKLKLLYLMARYRMSYSEGVRLFFEYVANWGGKALVYRFDFIKDGRIARSIERGPMSNTFLKVLPGRTGLEDGPSYDVACVRFRMEDEHGALLSYSNDVVSLSTSENLSIIGPSVLPLRGGMGGTYVKTNPAFPSALSSEGRTGEAFLKISCAGCEHTVKFNIKRNNL